MRKVPLIVLLVLCVFAVSCATSNTPRMNTRDDLMAYVQKAAAVVQREGPAAACAKFAEPAWMSGEWYIFINSAENDALLCHPARPEMVGQDQTNLRDSNGVYISRELRARATGPEGRGWVEYMWPRPGQTTPARKSAYVMAVTGPDGKRYSVGSGGYEMP